MISRSLLSPAISCIHAWSLPDDPLGRHAAVGEEHVVDLAAAHRLDPADLETVDLARDRDHRQPSCLLPVRDGAAHEQDVVGRVGAGDPGLLPVDHVPAVHALGAARQVADVRPGLGLGHRDRVDRPGDDPAEDLLLQRLAPEPLDRAGGHHGHREEAHRDLAAGELLAQQAQVDGATARAAVLLRDRDAEPAELGDLRVDLRVVGLASVVGERVALLARAALALGEVADRLDERALLVGQVQVAVPPRAAVRVRGRDYIRPRLEAHRTWDNPRRMAKPSVFRSGGCSVRHMPRLPPATRSASGR